MSGISSALVMVKRNSQLMLISAKLAVWIRSWNVAHGILRKSKGWRRPSVHQVLMEAVARQRSISIRSTLDRCGSGIGMRLLRTARRRM